MSEQLSFQVSRALDDLGYNEEMRQFRLDKYGEYNFVSSLCSWTLASQSMLAGSKAEGASNYFESDFDYLRIYSGVKAVERADIVQGKSELTLLMEEDSAPHGYCKLRFLQNNSDDGWHHVFLRHNCYVICHGCPGLYLSSMGMIQMRRLHLPYDTEISGPSNKRLLPGGREMDNVQAIRCGHMPNSFKKWIRRYQDQDWPGRQLMEEIAKSDIFLVPVGMHGTDWQHLQWRVSFNVPEKLLIQNFTAVQAKVYILLKMIKKEVIQPQCPESITSYIVKTIMLWTVEQIPVQAWSDRKLIDLLLHTLCNLHRCVQQGICPMYFIPECNILHGRMTKTTQRTICNILSSILSDRISCTLSLPTIQSKLVQYTFNPVPFREFSDDRKEKTNILLYEAGQVRLNSTYITNRDELFCCLQEQDRIPYEDLLTDLVSVSTPAGSEQEKLVKYIFRQTLSQTALQQSADAITQCGSNIHKYKRTRRCVKILHGNCNTDVLCGRVRLAQVFNTLGKYRAARDVLTIGADKIRYYMSKRSWRELIQTCFIHERLHAYCGNQCSSISHVLEQFFLADIHYDHQMELCLPKALQYEVYKSREGQRERIWVDPETLLYYLQYLCYKQLGERNREHAAFTNLVWCATQRESNIEYREVALNILGHCLMKKRLYDQAVKVLVKSIKLSKQYSHLDDVLGFRTIAAVWHIAILLNKYGRQRIV